MTGDGSGLGVLVVYMVWIVGLSALFLVPTVVWLVVPGLRARTKELPSFLVAIFVLFSIPAGYCVVTFGPALIIATIENVRKQNHDNPTIDEPTTFAGISFQKGTVFHYENNSNGSRKIVGATSLHPVSVGGMEITEARFEEFSQNRVVLLRLASNQSIEGWPCSTYEEPVKFSSHSPNEEVTAENWSFQSCKLAFDYRHKDFPFDNLTVDRSYDGSGWRIMNDRFYNDVEYSGFLLKNYFYAYLDAENTPIEWSSVLAKTTVFGDIQYSGNVHVSGYANGNYVFEVDIREPSVNTRTNNEVEGCVVYSARKEILGVYSSCSDAHEKASGRKMP